VSIQKQMTGQCSVYVFGFQRPFASPSPNPSDQEAVSQCHFEAPAEKSWFCVSGIIRFLPSVEMTEKHVLQNSGTASKGGGLRAVTSRFLPLDGGGEVGVEGACP